MPLQVFLPWLKKGPKSSLFLQSKHIFKRSFSFSASAILSFPEGSVFFHSEDLLESTFGSSFLILSKGSVTNKPQNSRGFSWKLSTTTLGSGISRADRKSPQKDPIQEACDRKWAHRCGMPARGDKKRKDTHPKTNISPEKCWLEDSFPF